MAMLGRAKAAETPTRPVASRILDMARHDRPLVAISDTAVAMAASVAALPQGEGVAAETLHTEGMAMQHVTPTEMKLQRLLELSRITKEMQRSHEMQMQQMRADDLPPPAAMCRPPSALPDMVHVPSADSDRPPQPPAAQLDKHELPRPSPMPYMNPKVRSHGLRSYSPSLARDRRPNGQIAVTHAVLSGQAPTAISSPALRAPVEDPTPEAPALEEDVAADEEDCGWEEELRRSLDERLRSADAKRKHAERRAGAVQQSLRRLRLDAAKGEKQVRTQLAEARGELDTAEQRGGARARVLRDGADRAEAHLDAMRADLNEAKCSECDASVPTAELADECARRKHDLDVLSTHIASVGGQSREFAELVRERRFQLTTERTVAQRLRSSIESSQEMLVNELASEMRDNPLPCSGNRRHSGHLAVALRERTRDGCSSECSSLAERLAAEQDRAATGEVAVQRVRAKLGQAEAELAGFQEALRLSIEVAGGRLTEELGELRLEESVVRGRLVALASEASASTTEGDTAAATPLVAKALAQCPTNMSRRLRATAEAMYAEFEEHQSIVAKLFQESSLVARSVSSAAPPPWSAYGSSAGGTPALELPSTVSRVLDASPALSLPPWPPSSQGSCASVRPGGHTCTGSGGVASDGTPSERRKASALPPLPPWPSALCAGSDTTMPCRPHVPPTTLVIDVGDTPMAMPLSFLVGAQRSVTPASSRSHSDWNAVAGHGTTIVSECETELENILRMHEVEIHRLSASLRGARCACENGTMALWKEAAARCSVELELSRLYVERGLPHLDQNISSAHAVYKRAEAQAEAVEEAAAVAASAVATAAAMPPAVGSTMASAKTTGGSQVDELHSDPGVKSTLIAVPPLVSLFSSICRLDGQVLEADEVIIGLRSRCAEAMEAHQLREAEVLATREVMSADSELYRWQECLEAEAHAFRTISATDRRLAQVTDEQCIVEELQRLQFVAQAEHKTWTSSTEVALQAEARAAHASHVEELVALDARLDRETSTRRRLELLANSCRELRSRQVAESDSQAALAQRATVRSGEGIELQEVYARRAHEAERICSHREAALQERANLQAELAAAHTEVVAMQSAVDDAYSRKSREAHMAGAETQERDVLQRMLKLETHEAMAASAQFTEELGRLARERQRLHRWGCSHARAVTENDQLLNEFVTARETCALHWRRLDKEEAAHVKLTEELDHKLKRRARQASVASATEAAVVAGAVDQVRARSMHALMIYTELLQCQRPLVSELREEEQECASLSFSLEEHAAATQGGETYTGLPFLRCNVQVAEEEEVQRLLDHIGTHRAECNERARDVTKILQRTEEFRAELQCADVEIGALESEASIGGESSIGSSPLLAEMKSLEAELLQVLVDKSSPNAELWVARAQSIIEVLGHERVKVLQDLQGLRKTDGVPGLEVLRVFQERLLLRVHALDAVENLECAEEQCAVEASVYEVENSEHELMRELEAATRDREFMSELVHDGREARRNLEQQLKWAIHYLQNMVEYGQEAQPDDAVDSDVLARMSVVMNEAYRFLSEQQARLEVVVGERDQLRCRLIDALEHLEGPEYAELAANATCVGVGEYAAAARSECAMDLLRGVHADLAAQAAAPPVLPLGARRPRPPPPHFCPPPTIVEEDDVLTSP